MSDQHTDHTVLYLKIFGALACLTLLTVGISYIDFPGHIGIFVGLAIASMKAYLVASIFMHLKWEKPIIYGILGLTVFLAIVMFVLPMVDFAWTDTATPTDVAAQGPSHAVEADASNH